MYTICSFSVVQCTYIVVLKVSAIYFENFLLLIHRYLNLIVWFYCCWKTVIGADNLFWDTYLQPKYRYSPDIQNENLAKTIKFFKFYIAKETLTGLFTIQCLQAEETLICLLKY